MNFGFEDLIYTINKYCNSDYKVNDFTKEQLCLLMDRWLNIGGIIEMKGGINKDE